MGFSSKQIFLFSDSYAVRTQAHCLKCLFPFKILPGGKYASTGSTQILQCVNPSVHLLQSHIPAWMEVHFPSLWQVFFCRTAFHPIPGLDPFPIFEEIFVIGKIKQIRPSVSAQRFFREILERSYKSM